MKYVLMTLMTVLMFSCSENSGKHKKTAELYFDLFSKRKELDKILSFYSDTFQYENINFETGTGDPKFLFEEGYGWRDPAMKYDTPESIQIEELLTNDYSIVAKGRTLDYQYNGKKVAGNRFVIWLDLDQEGKIIKQTDWFDYPMEEIIEAYELKKSLKIEYPEGQ